MYKHNKIVNLFAGPGSGKSTTASGLFHLLKLDNRKTELVTEYAKDAVYEQREKTLANQFYVSAKQHHRIWRILKYWHDKNVKNGTILTDSPFILGLMYLEKNDSAADKFKEFLLEEYNKMNNINIFITRVKKYDAHGRLQSEAEARKLDDDIRNFLKENSIQYIEVAGDKYAPETILKKLDEKGWYN